MAAHTTKNSRELNRHHPEFELALKMIKAGVPPYLVGPTGCGKTTLALQIAQKLKLNFYASGAVDSAFQLRGFYDAQGRLVRTNFRNAYENGGLFLFDELDASNPQAIVSFHAALDNGFLDAPDGMIEKHDTFCYMGGANTWGNGATLDYVGRNALDGATLDRYAFVPMDYDEEFERMLAKDRHPQQEKWPLIVQKARAVLRELDIRHLVSTRAILNGAALLDGGVSLEQAFASAVLKGMNPDDIVKVTHQVDLKNVNLIANKAAMANEAGRLAAMVLELQNTAGDVTAAVREAQEELRKAKQGIEDVRRAKDLLETANRTVSAAFALLGKTRTGMETLEHLREAIVLRSDRTRAAISEHESRESRYKVELIGTSPITKQTMYAAKLGRSLVANWDDATRMALERDEEETKNWRLPDPREAELIASLLVEGFNEAALGGEAQLTLQTRNIAKLAQNDIRADDCFWTSKRDGEYAIARRFVDGQEVRMRADSPAVVHLVRD